MWRVLALIIILAASVAYAQTVQVTSTQLTDSAGNPYIGAVYFQPTLSNGQPTAYRKGGGGTVMSSPVRVSVSAGMFAISLPDTTLTYPANICFKLTAPNLAEGYQCLQPHATPSGSGDWCQSGGCNLDNYLPDLSPQLPTTATTSINGLTGALTFAGSGVTQVGNTFTFNGGGSWPGYPSAGLAASNGSAWVSPTLAMVVSALGYTPYNSTNPSAFITASALAPYALTSALSAYQLALGFTPYNSTNPAGYLSSITSGNVITALGFTPYNATNPSGYIASSALSPYALTSSLGTAAFTASSAYDASGAASARAAVSTCTNGQYATGTGTSTTPCAQVAYSQVSGTPSLSGYVTSVTGTAPVQSSGGMNPAISMPAATTSINGYLTSTDWNTFNSKQAALGFTPYNATNPSGYITSSALSPYLLSATASSTYAPIFTLTTTGSSGAATYTGNVLNIPQYAGGGSMTWPAAAGIMVYAGGNAYGTSLTSPAGPIVGTTDTQTLTNKTLDGVAPTTMGYVDPTSSIQTQLNGKQASGSYALTTATTLSNLITVAGGTFGTAAFTASSAYDAYGAAAARQANLSLLPGTYTNGDMCTYASSGTLLNCNTAIPSVGTWGALNYPTYVSGTPFVKMTAAGTFALDTNTYQTSFTSQTANYFFAAPNGSSGTPLFRAIVAADIPTLNQNTTGTAANLSGTPALPNGTTATTQTAGDNTTKLATDAFVLANGSSYTLPTATSSTLGGVKPDGTTIANTAGAISVAYGTAANTAAQGNDSRITGAAQCTAGTSGSDCLTLSSGLVPVANLPTGTTSAKGALQLSTNGGAAQVIASGTAALGTSSIASGGNATVVTVAASGVATTDVIGWGFNGDPTSTLGYEPATTGMLTIIAYPTPGNVNFKVVNNTSAAITPGAITLNFYVHR